MSFLRMFSSLFNNRPRLETKKSATASVVKVFANRQAVWTPRDYSMFASEGFAKNPIVYRCVRMVSEAATSVPFKLLEEMQPLDHHPFLQLLSRPNAMQCGPDLLEAWYGYLLVAGNAYLEAVSVGDAVRELHVLRPDRMKVVPGSDGWPEAYEYSANGHSVRFDQNTDGGIVPILHMKMFHPTNDYYGQSPIEAAAIATDIHNQAGNWNKSLLDNSARPSGALVYNVKEGNLSSEQFGRLKSELEESYQGAMNAGRPLLLEGGLDWKTMSLSPRDMDFAEIKNIAAREIALAFGVPPMLLGIPGDNTYANYQEANRTFWRQTVLPLVDRTAKALSVWLSPAFDKRFELVPDTDRIQALSAEREALWNRVGSAEFLTLNEKRMAAGYGPVEGGETLKSKDTSAVSIHSQD